MKVVYCAKCGTKLNVMRKALQKYRTTIDIVQAHECLDTPIDFDLTPVDVPVFVQGKFVQKLNELSPPIPHSPLMEEIKDRRAPEHVKSTAPISLIDNIKRQIDGD